MLNKFTFKLVSNKNYIIHYITEISSPCENFKTSYFYFDGFKCIRQSRGSTYEWEIAGIKENIPVLLKDNLEKGYQSLPNISPNYSIDTDLSYFIVVLEKEVDFEFTVQYDEDCDYNEVCEKLDYLTTKSIKIGNITKNYFYFNNLKCIRGNGIWRIYDNPVNSALANSLEQQYNQITNNGNLLQKRNNL